MKTQNLNHQLFHLTMCKGIGATSRIRMLSALIDDPYLSAKDLAYCAGLNQRNKQLFMESYSTIDLNKTLEYYHKSKIGWISIMDNEYPEYLKKIYNPPALLFYKGDLSLLKESLLAVVGSRLKSPYGSEVLELLLPELISHGIVTVSGLAKGIDWEVHKKTIALGGHTIGIIGSGLDEYYPKENRSLQQEVARHHLLLSEYPLGTKPLKHHFPMRNRLIAGISLGTLVIEASYRSGSLITANLALQEGRDVFAVPGNITSSFSSGTNDIIQQGAKCVFTAKHILDELM